MIHCQKHGSRMKCSACNVVAHQSCINILVDRVRFTCKPSFRDVGVRQYREQTSIHHHWVHRRSEKGKCRHCGKVNAVIYRKSNTYIDGFTKNDKLYTNYVSNVTKLVILLKRTE